MPGTASPATRFDDDLAHGAIVIIAARWVLAGAGLALALWNPTGLLQLQVAVALILAVAVGNFALHMQLLTRGPLVAEVIYAASVADLAIISTLILVSGGYPTSAYVFYFPALLAISVTFRTSVVAAYTLAAMAVYGVIAAAAVSPDAGGTIGVDEVVGPATELLMLAGVAVCGNVYWRLERQRRGGSSAVEHAPRKSAATPTAGERVDPRVIPAS